MPQFKPPILAHQYTRSRSVHLFQRIGKRGPLLSPRVAPMEDHFIPEPNRTPRKLIAYRSLNRAFGEYALQGLAGLENTYACWENYFNQERSLSPWLESLVSGYQRILSKEGPVSRFDALRTALSRSGHYFDLAEARFMAAQVFEASQDTLWCCFKNLEHFHDKAMQDPSMFVAGEAYKFQLEDKAPWFLREMIFLKRSQRSTGDDWMGRPIPQDEGMNYTNLIYPRLAVEAEKPEMMFLSRTEKMARLSEHFTQSLRRVFENDHEAFCEWYAKRFWLHICVRHPAAFMRSAEEEALFRRSGLPHVFLLPYQYNPMQVADTYLLRQLGIAPNFLKLGGDFDPWEPQSEGFPRHPLTSFITVTREVTMKVADLIFA